VLSCGQGPPAPLRASLEAIAAQPFVEHVLALPDLHHKENAEAPSSLAVVTRGAIVPEFTSVAINDGMGVVVTDLQARDVTHVLLARFFRAVNAHAAPHLLARNRYSLSAPDLERAAFAGGAAVIERYGLDPHVLEAMESCGRVEVPGAVARSRTWSRRCCAIHPPAAARWGSTSGATTSSRCRWWRRSRTGSRRRAGDSPPAAVVVTYHLGPGPFSGTLLHFYGRRKALKRPRVPWFFLGKLGFHLGRVRRHPRRAWAVLFRRNDITALAPDSAEGLHFRQALAMAVNVGFAYRLATVAAIRDALRETFRPPATARLLCDIPHNSLGEERRDGGAVWVARHNACRWRPDRPGVHRRPPTTCPRISPSAAPEGPRSCTRTTTAPAS
jgi:hypothetical protein